MVKDIFTRVAEVNILDLVNGNKIDLYEHDDLDQQGCILLFRIFQEVLTTQQGTPSDTIMYACLSCPCDAMCLRHFDLVSWKPTQSPEHTTENRLQVKSSLLVEIKDRT